ncbi:PE-PGRS family protein [Dyadobacter jejuensis]|uniref:PE-PGRS family protein n=1 Tax=Dyadobacter jejuensis TaxID=1082580 RepID=UPI0011B1E0E6|nr:PE-PGRS family protein [Dyadobacter jejuensis]
MSTCLLATLSCKTGDGPLAVSGDEFQTIPTVYPIVPGIIDEASGIAPAQYLTDYLWTIQDSGGPNSVYLLAKNSSTITEYSIPGANNIDWEDIASGHGPEEGKQYLYVADIGNNSGIPISNTIYRMPDLQSTNGSFESQSVEKIEFRYPDGFHNSEALLLDPTTLDLIVISKEASQAVIYRIPYPQSTTEVNMAEKVGVIPGINLVTAGDISAKGDEILIRTYLSVSYWRVPTGQTILQTLQTSAHRSYLVALEPQGEGICFDHDLKGYFTVSELGAASSVGLNYFKRK